MNESGGVILWPPKRLQSLILLNELWGRNIWVGFVCVCVGVSMAADELRREASDYEEYEGLTDCRRRGRSTYVRTYQ